MIAWMPALPELAVAAASLLLLALQWRTQISLRRATSERDGLRRELDVWRHSAIGMGKRLDQVASGSASGNARGSASESGAARVRESMAGRDDTLSAQVIPLRVPEWLPDDASDEDLALASGMMRSEAHLANRLRQLARRVGARGTERSRRKR